MDKLLRRLVVPIALMFSLMQTTAHAESQGDLIKRGEYLAVAGDCAACHTEEGKAPFTGGHAIGSPLGIIFSTNITPSKTAGIGHYSEKQFADALRKGIRADGSHLYPAMPYTAYARINDSDISALYAYFMYGVKADDTQPEKTALPFPFNLRFSMAAWNLLFLDGKPFTPDPSQSAEWNRGAYLVEGLTHCSTCHTPRNFLMAEESDKSLQGASLGTWYAPAITSAALQSDDQWSRESLAAYLASGHADNGATAAGPMLEAIDKSFSRMTPDDRAAIATYLLPAVDHEDDSTDADADSEEPTVGLTPVTGDDTPDMLSDMTDGEQIYRNNCASCHNLEGQGLNGLPALTKHPVLEKSNADNVAMVILDGVWPAKGQGMLSFAKTLNDTQIADVTNYVMQDIGNSAVRITPELVKALRQGGEPSLLLPLVRGAMVAGVLVVIGGLFWWWRRRR
ncbi:cytochrome c [Pantoea stewartii]|uniref:cytochrome c n=1 Tax=Pantoea stewartii TaxID=66269 RepID=UPI000736B1C4|nr:cytochrome c [Pantoea stewartii]KTS26271.1 cytochrome C [Pantoea stewartii]